MTPIEEYTDILIRTYALDKAELLTMWKRAQHSLRMLLVQLDWPIYLEAKRKYFKELESAYQKERDTHELYPPHDQVFRSLKLCPYNSVRVVILGQDPYHTPNMADGLCFSVDSSIKRLPSSLMNIYKELESDTGHKPENGSLVHWAKQGVLLLNTCLTVRKGEALSHRKLGWQKFTKHVIKLVNDHDSRIVFLLWGKKAQEYKKYISDRHHILETSHPSGMSAYNGFIGCKHFTKTNALLEHPIRW